MALTNRYYGGTSLGAGRTIQDFGLCDLNGNFVYTARSRAKGLLVVVFFSTESAASATALKAVQQWSEEIPAAKWSALGVAGPDRKTLSKYAEEMAVPGVTILIDHELYQTRSWAVSELPITFLIDGKTGAILEKAVGDDAGALASIKQTLSDRVAKMLAAEAAAKKADEEKKAAEAAAKAAEPAKA